MPAGVSGQGRGVSGRCRGRGQDAGVWARGGGGGKALDGRPGMCQGRRVNFSDLGLLPSLVRAVTDAGYTDPTPIQVEAIPPA